MNNHQYTQESGVLYMAIELGGTKWALMFATRLGQKPRRRSVAAGDLDGLQSEIAKARRYFGLAPDAPVYSCYEAGRDGFWPHRFLLNRGVRNAVVDSASVEVSQRQRRVKTDRLDAKNLLRRLIRYHQGEDESLSVVRVPTESEEDQRRIQREMRRRVEARKAQRSRIQALLNLKGIRVNSVHPRLAERLPELVGAGGQRLGPCERAEIDRELRLLQVLNDQIQEIRQERRRRLREEDSEPMRKIGALQCLHGIGEESSWLFVTEMFGWREFSNVREVSALSGLAPSVYGSDQTVREQGISKAGNERVRTMAVEIAWKWLEHQPHSALSQWFERRFANQSSRVRRNGITALARKLVVSLWKYLEWGEVPAGAVLSEPPS